MGPVLTKLVNSRWAVFLLLVVTTLAYIGAVGAGFVWDDFPLVVDNPKAQSFDQWRLWFTEDLWSLGADSVQSGFYRPLVLASFAVDHALWGENPAGFHLQSLMWHLGCVSLLFHVLNTVVERESAWVAAAIFCPPPCPH